MSEYTAELRTVIEQNYDIFDFEYTRTAASQAIISDDNLEAGFKNRYYFRELGFETLERFKQRLKTQWLESIGNFDLLLVAYNDSVNIKKNVNLSTENDIVFNDTPDSVYSGTENMSTNTTENTQSQNGLSGITEIEALELYHNKIKDIQSEFYDSFDNLFMQIL